MQLYYLLWLLWWRLLLIYIYIFEVILIVIVLLSLLLLLLFVVFSSLRIYKYLISSVHLRCVYLGCFVPANFASFRIVDKLFCRMGESSFRCALLYFFHFSPSFFCLEFNSDLFLLLLYLIMQQALMTTSRATAVALCARCARPPSLCR